MPGGIRYHGGHAPDPGAGAGLAAFYLGARGHHDITDAALDEFLRQQATTGRLSWSWVRPTLWMARPLTFEQAPRHGSVPLDQQTVCVPSVIDWGHYELAFVECAASTANAIAYAGELTLTCRDRLQDAEPINVTSLKKRFQQANVPPWRRGTYPICIDATGLVAIPSIWRRSTSRLTPERYRSL